VLIAARGDQECELEKAVDTARAALKHDEGVVTWTMPDDPLRPHQAMMDMLAAEPA
jgi:hypothetical protein